MWITRFFVSSPHASVIRIICTAWLIAKCISWKLWLSDRFFPVIPVSEYFPSAPHFVHASLFAFSIIVLFALLLFPTSKLLMVLLIFLELSACLLDQMRWQPWEYQYLLSLVLFLLARDRKQFLWLIGLLLAATYFFSGLHKFSGGFLYNIWDKLILKRLFGIPVAIVQLPVVHYAGLLIPIAEMTIGLGLLLTKKRGFVFGAVLMHLAITVALSPAFFNFNVVVIPWNLAMVSLVLVCFGTNRSAFNFNFLKNIAGFVSAALMIVLPTMGLFGYWDNYLSFSLYSGNTNELTICTDDKRLIAYANKNSKRCAADKVAINANKWALDELKVPMYPEKRSFKAFKSNWQKWHPDKQAIFISTRYPYRSENIEEIE